DIQRQDTDDPPAALGEQNAQRTTATVMLPPQRLPFPAGEDAGVFGVLQQVIPFLTQRKKLLLLIHDFNIDACRNNCAHANGGGMRLYRITIHYSLSDVRFCAV